MLYIWSSTQSYQKLHNRFLHFTVSDELGIEETINTPIIAQFDSSCVAAVMRNQSSDPNKVEFNLGLYSVEPFGNNLYSYIRAPFKQTQGSTSGNGGVTSPEFLIKTELLIQLIEEKQLCLLNLIKHFSLKS